MGRWRHRLPNRLIEGEFLLGDLSTQFVNVTRLEGVFTTEQIEHGDAEGPHVARRPICLILVLLLSGRIGVLDRG